MIDINHEIKILPEHFESVVKREKRAELRIGDRFYKVGDVVCMYEVDETGEQMGGIVYVVITHILEGVEGMSLQYVMWSFEVLQVKLS